MFVAGVCLAKEHVVRDLLQILERRCPALFIAAGDHDLGALLEKRFCCGQADSRGASGDDGGLSFDLEHEDSLGLVVRAYVL